MNNFPETPILLKLKYTLKKKTKNHNVPVRSFENPITRRRLGRTKIYKYPNIIRKMSVETKIDAFTNQTLSHEIIAVNEEQQWTHSEKNVCKKTELIDFGRESNQQRIFKSSY